MSEDDFGSNDGDFQKGHQDSQPYQSWCPNGAQPMDSALSGQIKFYFESGVKNIENINKITIDSQYREICPVWKPALQGTHSIFEST